jgi:hypothetical protein
MTWELEVGKGQVWNGIQVAARDKRVLVYAIDQFSDDSQTDSLPGLGPWDDAARSRFRYRTGLAARWIDLAYQGKDFPFSQQWCEFSPLEIADALSWVSATDWISYWKAVIQPLSCTVTGLKGEHAHAPSAAFICQVVFRAYGCYGVTLEGPNGTHSVAMRNAPDGRLHLFDDSFFHVAIKGPDAFQSFVSWWLEETGYRKQFTQRTGVVGIRPPINRTHP